jgi:hypothetical protein
VTVQSSDPTVENSQTVRVGLYVSPNAAITTTFAAVASHLAASPVEPIVAITGGPGTDVRIYNVYNGVLLRTLTGVAAAPAALKFNGDGTRLYVHDTTNLNVRAVDPVTGAQLATFDATSISPDYRGRAVELVRPNGYEVLITPGGKIYDTASGAYYANAPYFSAVLALSMAHSPDQRLVAPHFGSVSRFARTALRGGGLEVELLNLGVLASDSGETCFNEAGDRIYATYWGGNPNYLPATSLTTGQVVQQLPAPLYPSSIRCVWNGLIVGGSQSPLSGDDVVTYNGTTGVSRGSLAASTGAVYQQTLLRRGFDVSADGSRLISLYGGYAESLSTGVSMQTLPTTE